MKPALRSWLPWGLLLVALVVVLVVGGGRSDGPATNAERVDHLASQVRCPACRSQSVAESDALASQSLKEEIARRVEAGQTDGEVLAYVVSKFGDSILLVPPSGGVNSLVWVLPVVGLVLAAGGLVIAFRRWHAMGEVAPVAEADRELVAAALAAEARDDVGEGSGR